MIQAWFTVIMCLSFSKFSYGQSSCVRLTRSIFEACPCDAASFMVSLEASTSPEHHTVNVAIAVDGSGSVDSTDFELEKEFAKDVVAAFDDAIDLFDNNGTASYVQYSDYAESSGVFSSQDYFDCFVDNDDQAGTDTNIASGIAEARILLAADKATAAYMIVVVEADYNACEDAKEEADAARAEGIEIFAVGVGSSVSLDALVDIAGDDANVFAIDSFDHLTSTVADIMTTTDITNGVPCPATNVSITANFSSPTVSASISVGDAVISGQSSVAFFIESLEGDPTDFAIVIDTCSDAKGTEIVEAATYSDDQGNSPSFNISKAGNVDDCATAPPTSVPTVGPTSARTMAPTPAPTVAPTPGPTMPMCSNGVVGVEGFGVCCVLGCGECGGSGCKDRAEAAGLSASDCCSRRIRDSGIMCDMSDLAPCIM